MNFFIKRILRIIPALRSGIMILLFSSLSHAAEILNNDGNHLFLSARVNVSRYLTENNSLAGDVSWARLGVTGQTDIMII